MAIFIAFGANLSNPEDGFPQTIAEAFVAALKKLAQSGVDIDAVSSLWRSPSWPPGKGYPDYLNGVVQVKYKGQADALLNLLNKLEAEFGRARSVRNAPRPLDLDIIDFNGEMRHTPHLTLPHARMGTRPFVLFPLAEIAPGWTHPITGASVMDLIGALGPAQMAGFAHDRRAIEWYKQSPRG